MVTGAGSFFLLLCTVNISYGIEKKPIMPTYTLSIPINKHDNADGIYLRIYEPQLKVVDGKVKIPDGPGWGVEINQNWLESANYQISEI